MTFQTFFKRAPVTVMLLIAIIALFIWQVLTGVDINNPSSKDLVDWGANFFPLTFDGEPWRLISSAFLHIGFMHLMFNGFALYFFGQVVEPLFGSVKFLALFLLSAIGGGLLGGYVTWLSVQKFDFDSVGIAAGASGGIMGLGMALLVAELMVFMRHKKLRHTMNGAEAPPNNTRQLKSLALIMGINLAFGFVVPGIDNAGHIGGAITGAVLSIGLVFAIMNRVKRATNTSQKMVAYQKAGLWQAWLTIIAVAVVYAWLWFYLSQAWQAFVALHT